MADWGVPPVNDDAMWRKLKRQVHPDTTGQDTTELFTWVCQLEEHTNKSKSLKNLSPAEHAAKLAHYGRMNLHSKTGWLLSLLIYWKEEEYGASQKLVRVSDLNQLGDAVGMSSAERKEFHEVAVNKGLTSSEFRCIINNIIDNA